MIVNQALLLPGSSHQTRRTEVVDLPGYTGTVFVDGR